MSPGSHGSYARAGFAMRRSRAWARSCGEVLLVPRGAVTPRVERHAGDDADTKTHLDAGLDDIGVRRGRHHVQRKPVLFGGGE